MHRPSIKLRFAGKIRPGCGGGQRRFLATLGMMSSLLFVFAIYSPVARSSWCPLAVSWPDSSAHQDPFHEFNDCAVPEEALDFESTLHDAMYTLGERGSCGSMPRRPLCCLSSMAGNRYRCSRRGFRARQGRTDGTRRISRNHSRLHRLPYRRTGHPRFAGGLPIKSPFGIIYSTNITPDTETGIGRYSYDDFARALREGVAKHGKRLYPAITCIRQLSEHDMNRFPLTLNSNIAR